MKLPISSLRLAIPSGVVILLVVTGAFLFVTPSNHTSVVTSADTYKKQLQGQVDTTTGSPRDGRDPASQQQNSLADAASKPTGTGKQPNTAVNTQSAASPVLTNGTNAQQTGLGVNGCYIDYGIQGQECLAAHVAVNGVPTCDGVRTHGGFPNGIKVTGTDRYHLDSNHDGIACGTGD